MTLKDWTPISEKLPPKDVEVLATLRWKCVTIATRIWDNEWFIYDGNANALTEDIIAWTEMPKPYAEGDNK